MVYRITIKHDDETWPWWIPCFLENHDDIMLEDGCWTKKTSGFSYAFLTITELKKQDALFRVAGHHQRGGFLHLWRRLGVLLEGSPGPPPHQESWENSREIPWKTLMNTIQVYNYINTYKYNIYIYILYAFHIVEHGSLNQQIWGFNMVEYGQIRQFCNSSRYLTTIPVTSQWSRYKHNLSDVGQTKILKWWFKMIPSYSQVCKNNFNKKIKCST